MVAAIAEKDAHIALLEQSRERPREEIETLRHHKEKLMEKLKEENERRAQLLSSTNLSVGKRSALQIMFFKNWSFKILRENIVRNSLCALKIFYTSLVL